MAKAAKKRSLPDVADLTKAQAKTEHMRLALELEGHDRRYYQDDAPSVTDAEYDALRARFNAVEKRFPELGPAWQPEKLFQVMKELATDDPAAVRMPANRGILVDQS